jgi:hypothetical protein
MGDIWVGIQLTYTQAEGNFRYSGIYRCVRTLKTDIWVAVCFEYRACNRELIYCFCTVTLVHKLLECVMTERKVLTGQYEESFMLWLLLAYMR